MEERHSRRSRLATLIVVCALTSCATTPPTETESNIDLTGEWILNETLSDTPSEVLRAVTRESDGPGLLRQIGGSIRVFGISVDDVIGMLPNGNVE